METPVGLMPDLIANPSRNILPVWDSFEALFFVIAGVIVGFVLGYLFPSICRSLRRRFRSYRRYILTDIPWHRTLELDLKILGDGQETPLLSAVQENELLIQSFVIARDLVQRGELRHAVRIYGEILTSEQARTLHIHRALFELAQVYFSLGLFARAFDTALELLKRIPRDEQIFRFLLIVLSKYADEEKISKTFRVFKGVLNDGLKKLMVHLTCSYAAAKLQNDRDQKKVIELIRLALRLERFSTYSLFLLWLSSTQRVRGKTLNIKAKWVAFAAHLNAWIHLCEKTGLSPHAGASHIFAFMVDMMTIDPNFKYFEMIQSEVHEIINFLKFSASQQKIILESIFSVVLLLREMEILITEQNCFLFFNKICNDKEILQRAFFVNDIINPELFKFGISVHRCQNCQTIFERFSWSCRGCHSTEPLKVYLPLFTGYTFDVNKNWNPHKNNSD